MDLKTSYILWLKYFIYILIKFNNHFSKQKIVHKMLLFTVKYCIVYIQMHILTVYYIYIDRTIYIYNLNNIYVQYIKKKKVIHIRKVNRVL